MQACGENEEVHNFGYYVWHPGTLNKQLKRCSKANVATPECATLSEYKVRYNNLEQDIRQKQSENAEVIPLYRQAGETEKIRELVDELNELQELLLVKKRLSK